MPHPGLVLGTVVEDHRTQRIPARFEPRPLPVLLGDEDVAQHRAGDLAPAGTLANERELALLDPHLPTKFRELPRQVGRASTHRSAYTSLNLGLKGPSELG